MGRSLCLSFLLLFGGCDQEDRDVPTTSSELTGSTAERVAGIRRIIERNVPVPSPIEDAHLIETQFGDDVLGPADYLSYIWIKVAIEDVEEWRRTLKALTNQSLIFDEPRLKAKWWLSQEEFEQLDKYDPFPMFQRHGWIVIEDNGNVFARTYTM